jgi:hypothetical protein
MNLGEFVATLRTEGATRFRQEVEASHSVMVRLDKQGRATSVTYAEATKKATEFGIAATAAGRSAGSAFAGFAGLADRGFGGLTNTMGGFLRMGLRGTAEGARLELTMTRLAREIAGVALPAIEKMTEAVSGLVKWFESLSGAQQDTLMNIGLTAAALRMLGVTAGGVAGVVKAHPVAAGAAAVVGAGGFALGRRKGQMGDIIAKSQEDRPATPEEVEGSQLAAFVRSDRYKGMTKDERLAAIRKAALDANETVEGMGRVQEGQRGFMGMFNAGGIRRGAEEMEVARRERNLALKAAKQVEAGGDVNLEALKGKSEDKDRHRRPSILPGGITSGDDVYRQIAERAAKWGLGDKGETPAEKLGKEIRDQIKDIKDIMAGRPGGAGI